jgi:hypothetical protein
LATALYTSPYMGPWLNVTIGQESSTLNLKECHIRPGSTSITEIVNGVKTTDGHQNALSSARLETLIGRAADDRLIRALHVMETVPNLNVIAGDNSVFIAPIVLHKDSGSLEYRDGRSSRALLRIAKQECGEF